MMEKKVKEQMSLHRFLARNILILIVAAVIIAAGTLFAGDYLGRALVKQPDVSVILNQSALYEKEDYKSIKTGTSLGENGYFQILDANAELLYTSSKTKENSLTLESLDYVPDAASGTIFTIERQTDEYGENYYFIHRMAFILTMPVTVILGLVIFILWLCNSPSAALFTAKFLWLFLVLLYIGMIFFLSAAIHKNSSSVSQLRSGVLCFPIFVLSWLILAPVNLFRRSFVWKPVEHNVSRNIEDMK
jgi:hypothetical protein